MTTPVISPDNSRHFATLDGILQQQKVVVSSCELESHLFTLFFLALGLAVISWVVETSTTGLELDTIVIVLEWSLTSFSSIINSKTLWLTQCS